MAVDEAIEEIIEDEKPKLSKKGEEKLIKELVKTYKRRQDQRGERFGALQDFKELSGEIKLSPEGQAFAGGVWTGGGLTLDAFMLGERTAREKKMTYIALVVVCSIAFAAIIWAWFQYQQMIWYIAQYSHFCILVSWENRMSLNYYIIYPRAICQSSINQRSKFLKGE